MIDVTGFIIGVEGKNINSIRDISKAKVEVFSKDIVEGLREIEIQGSPLEITIAAEKIYKTVNKYYYYNNNTEINSKKRVRVSLGNKRNGIQLFILLVGRITKSGRMSKSRSQVRSQSPQQKMSKSLSRKKSESYHSLNIKNVINEPHKNPESYQTKEYKTFIEGIKKFNLETTKECEQNQSNLPKTNFSFMVSNEDLNTLLKNTQSNIFIELENKFNCAIDKRKEVDYF